MEISHRYLYLEHDDYAYQYALLLGTVFGQTLTLTE